MKARGLPSITVAICTRDRPKQLGALLVSLGALDVPVGLEWEILVVDNGTGDTCPDVIAPFVAALPIRLARASVGGLSHARNRAVEEARGDYICWVDDDAVVDRLWLRGYLKAFQRHPDASIFGGRIVARLEEPVPRWIDANRDMWQLKCLFSERDVAAIGPILKDRNHTPWGANYAVRTIDQKRFRYDPSLGLSPDHNRIGEESDMIHRMLIHGASGYWAPEPLVFHLIPRSRLTRSYLHSYFVKAGETAAYLEGRSLKARGSGSGRRPWAGERYGPVIRMIAQRLLSLATALVGQSRLSMLLLSRSSIYEGRLGHAKRSRSTPSSFALTPATAERESC